MKLALYAQASVPEFWLLDLKRDAISVHRQPDAEGHYAVNQALRRGAVLAPAAVPDDPFDVAALLG